MDTTRAIQAAVARADLILCEMIRFVVVVALLAFLMLLAVLKARKLVDPYRQNYYMPGCDITSEGPEDGDPWYDEDEGW